MSTIRCYDSNGAIIDDLFQWDENVSVKISDIDTTNVSELHFCNRKSEVALIVTATKSNGAITASIPNVLLRQPESIVIFICESLSNGETRTTNVCRIPIHPRPRPDDKIYVEEESGDKPTLGGGTDSGTGGGATTLDGAVMYNETQALTDEQKAIARGNIGAASDSDFMAISIYDPQGKHTDIFKYVDDKVAEGGGNSGETTEEPTVTSIEMVQTDSMITITYTMDDESTSVDTITLDANGYPVNINVDGADIPITLSGFSDGG